MLVWAIRKSNFIRNYDWFDVVAGVLLLLSVAREVGRNRNEAELMQYLDLEKESKKFEKKFVLKYKSKHKQFHPIRAPTECQLVVDHRRTHDLGGRHN